MGVPIICLGCQERAEIPFIPADLTCVACKTGEHIDLDDSIDVTASSWEYGLDPSKGEGKQYGCAQDMNCSFVGNAEQMDKHYQDHKTVPYGSKQAILDDLPMALLPSGVPDEDQDMPLLDEEGKKRRVTVPKGSAPYTQRALASRLDPKQRTANQDGAADATGETFSDADGKTCPDCNGAGAVPQSGGEDPDDVDNGYVRCSTCQGTGHVSKTASLTKAADLSAIRSILAQFNGKNVTITYDDDLGLHTVSGPLTYHPPAVMVGRSATTDVHVLQATVNGYGDFPDQRTEPVDGSSITMLQGFPSGATAAKTKVAEIADAVQESNPGMDRKAALRVARLTVQRYPKVASQA